MCAPSGPCSSPGNSHPHAEFLSLCPLVERQARLTFRHRNPAEREEAVAEAVAAAFESYVRLKKHGKDPVQEVPAALASFAVLHSKEDRHVGGRSNSRDVLSPKARRQHGFRVESLPISFRTSFEHLYAQVSGQEQQDAFEECLWANLQTPVVDQVCFRLDWPAFLRTLTRRDRQLARFLALGHSAKAAAQKFGLSPGRVTQLRQQWQRDWLVFQGEATAQS
jgi:hypothetical protein